MVKSPNGPISCPWPLQQPSAVPPPESSAAGTARHLQEAGSLGQQLQTAIDLWSPVKFKGKSSGHTTWIKIVHDCMIILHSIIIFYNYKVFFNIRNQKNLAISSLTRRPQVLRAVPSPWNAWIFQNRCEICVFHGNPAESSNKMLVKLRSFSPFWTQRVPAFSAGDEWQDFMACCGLLEPASASTFACSKRFSQHLYNLGQKTLAHLRNKFFVHLRKQPWKTAPLFKVC